MSNRQEKLIKNTMVLSIANICSKGMTFIIAPFVARWLMSKDYGIYDLVITYMSLLTPLVILDCGEAMFRFMLDANNEEKKKVITNTTVIALLGLTLCSIILVGLSVYNNNDIYIYILVLLLVQVINNYLMMYMRGLKKISQYAVSNIIYMIFMVIFTYIFVFEIKCGLKGILIAHIVGYVGSIFFILVQEPIIKWLNLKYLSIKEIKSIIMYSLPLIPNAVSWWIMSASDRTIVRMFLNSSANGILAVAHKIPAICEVGYSMFHISWQESASEEIDKQDSNLYFNKVLNYVVVFIAGLCAIVMSCNYLFVYCFFGMEYVQAYEQVPILLVAVFISAIGQFFGGINIARKNTKINGLTTSIGAIINIIVHIVLIGVIGLYAATISTLISNLVVLIMRYIEIRKVYRFVLSKKAFLSMGVLMLVFTMQYVLVKNIYVCVFEIFISGILFLTLNKNLVMKIMNRIIKRD